jgi:uncharacterized protein YpmB
MKDNVCEIVEQFEEKAMQVYSWHETDGKYRCDNCRYSTLDGLNEDEKEFINLLAKDKKLAKCKKMSELVSKEAEIEDDEEPLSMFAMLNGICSLYEGPNEP